MRRVLCLSLITATCCAVMASADDARTQGKVPARFGVEEPGAWGEPVDLEVWGQRTADGPVERFVTLTNDAIYLSRDLPGSASFRLVPKSKAKYDAAFFYVFSTDGHSGGWGPGPMEPGAAIMEPVDGGLTKLVPGQYRAKGGVLKGTNSVGLRKLYFTIQYAPVVPPKDTTYLKGKKDSKGNPITVSKPVELAPLNETAKLKDNDYPFEPQKAFDVVNWERFPPFKLNSKFVLVWDSIRYLDEPMFGGPLNRGFTVVAHTLPNEALPIAQRTHFGYPGEVEGHFRNLAEQDPKKHGSLLNWMLVKDGGHRSPWISTASVHQASINYYNSCAGGGNSDLGMFSWDEEEMWHEQGTNIFIQKPEFLPEELKELQANDPKIEKPETAAIVNGSYAKYWAEFLGWSYKGAVDAAAARGRKLTIFHYGSFPIGLNSCRLFAGSGDPSAETPVTYETPDSLFSWYKNSKGEVDFNDNTYTRTVKYYNKDSYFFYVGPQRLSMYEKDKTGKYVLDATGRRQYRTDVVEESVYAKPTKIGYEDYLGAPANMKEFIAKQENTLFWFNGGKYYKQSGTLTSDRRPVPTMRPGSQNTMPNKTAELGSQPVTPYLAEAGIINNFMIGVEGIFLWDENRVSTLAGQLDRPDKAPACFGDLEFVVKGLHRLSQFNKLFDGNYSFVRPMRQHDVWNRDQPIIRGIINGPYLLLTMSNPFLDFGEKQEIEVWYDKPYAQRKAAKWSDKVTILPRQNHLFQCRLPVPPAGGYDPDKLYFRFTCVDGSYTKTYTLSGNYDVKYSHKD